MSTDVTKLPQITGNILETVLVGLSAYELAKKYGFQGTEEEWLKSLNVKVSIDNSNGNYIVSFISGGINQELDMTALLTETVENKYIKELTAAQEYTDTKIQDLSEGLREKLNSLTNKIEENVTSINNLSKEATAKHGAFEFSIENLGSKNVSIEEKADKNTASIEECNTKIENNSNLITENSNAVKANSESITTLSETVTTVQTSIQDILERLTVLENNSSVDVPIE